IGLTNTTTMTSDNRSDRFYFGIGSGVYASYRITDWFAPMAGIQYMHSLYSKWFGNTTENVNNMTVFIGIKLAERD
ncbi:MAG: hypothetical protein ACFNLN_10750, partial [Treponema socranskii subsp. buccale]